MAAAQPIADVPQQGGLATGTIPMAAAQSIMHVTCPEGVTAGQFIQITTPAGQSLQVAVPTGVAPGSVFSVQVPV